MVSTMASVLVSITSTVRSRLLATYALRLLLSLSFSLAKALAGARASRLRNKTVARRADFFMELSFHYFDFGPFPDRQQPWLVVALLIERNNAVTDYQ